VLPVATPSQYCVITPDQDSPLVPRPLKKPCRIGAVFCGSPLNVALPLASVPWLPHCEPQNTRYTFGAPVVTPTPPVPPPYWRLFRPRFGRLAPRVCTRP
jgi:hypothetical protein